MVMVMMTVVVLVLVSAIVHWEFTTHRADSQKEDINQFIRHTHRVPIVKLLLFTIVTYAAVRSPTNEPSIVIVAFREIFDLDPSVT